MSTFTFSKADHREELVQRLIFKLCSPAGSEDYQSYADASPQVNECAAVTGHPLTLKH